VWVRYQTRVIEEVMRKEGFGRDRIPDLFFVNYKEIDDVGHNWNMLGRQTRDTLRASDDMLARLIRWLDETVGRNRWVIALTADHGQTPLPTEVGAWPIRMNALTYDVARHFGVRAGDLFAEERPTGLWLRRSTMAANGITSKEIASYLLDYRIRDNASAASDVPRQYRKRMGERVFSAVFPGRSLGSIWRCARRATPQ
jgi:predicted AlkP superfamily pyrophosphatase or phosphodiesterase